MPFESKAVVVWFLCSELLCVNSTKLNKSWIYVETLDSIRFQIITNYLYNIIQTYWDKLLKSCRINIDKWNSHNYKFAQLPTMRFYGENFKVFKHKDAISDS